jgi:hypothetical protein
MAGSDEKYAKKLNLLLDRPPFDHLHKFVFTNKKTTKFIP